MTTTDTTTQTKRGRGRPTRSEAIAIHQSIAKMALKHPEKSRAEISRQMDVSRETVKRALDKFAIKQDELVAYQGNRVEIIQGIQRKLLHTLATKDCSEASPQQLATSAAILIDKERLLTGQSTANIATFSHLVTEVEGNEIDVTPEA